MRELKRVDILELSFFTLLTIFSPPLWVVYCIFGYNINCSCGPIFLLNNCILIFYHVVLVKCTGLYKKHTCKKLSSYIDPELHFKDVSHFIVCFYSWPPFWSHNKFIAHIIRYGYVFSVGPHGSLQWPKAWHVVVQHTPK